MTTVPIINIGEKKMSIFIRRRSYLKIFILAMIIIAAILFQSRTYSYLVNPSVRVNRERNLRLTRMKEIDKLLPQSTSANKKKVILLYTTFFGLKFWSNRNQQAFNREMSEVCPKENCIYTYDHALHLKTADALLFHGKDVGQDDVKYMPSDLISLRHANKAYHQNWIFLSHESPMACLPDDKNKPYNNVFNWTATYNRLSDAFIPYGRYERINTDKNAVVQPTNMKKNYAASKTSLVAWQVSNCGPQLRLKYVKKLEKYVDLVVFGGCAGRFKNKGGTCPRSNFNKCEEGLKKFKFYLSFENSFCTDYVTEKYWNALSRESVPVIMADSTDEPGGAMIPGSFIDVHQFKSIKELADYLKFLDGNDAEYNKYFAWKDKFRTVADYSIYCEICFQLNNQAGEQKVKELAFTDKFSRSKTCNQWPDRRRDLERQIAEG